MSVSGIASSSEPVSLGLASGRLSTRVVFETVRVRYLELRTSLNMCRGWVALPQGMFFPYT